MENKQTNKHHDNLKYGRPMIAKQASTMSMSELTLSLLQRDQPEIWHYLDQMPHSTPRAGLLYRVAKKSIWPVTDLSEGFEWYRGSPDSTNFVLPGNSTIAKIVLSGD